MLIQTSLYAPPVNIEEKAIKFLRAMIGNKIAYFGYSGGKDSGVVRELLRRSGVNFETHYHITSCDPPELIRFISQECPEAIFDRPPTTIWKLIVEKGPPLVKKRYCCKILKEYGGHGEGDRNKLVVLGIRRSESTGRKNRKAAEICSTTKRNIINPIIDWSLEDVWDYIHYRKIKYCSLYDEGWKRLGCVMCPMSDQVREAKRWPKYAEAYRRAFNRLYQKGIDNGKPFLNWESGDEMYYWWIAGGKGIDPNTLRLFDLYQGIEDDSDESGFGLLI